MNRRPRLARIVFGAFAYGGIALLLLAALFLGQTLAVAAGGQRAEGVVIDNVWSNGGETATAQAVVRFEAAGRTVQFKSPVGSSTPLHHVHDQVPVYYWPDKPEEAVVGSFADWYLRPIILSAWGLVFLAIGGGFLWGPGWFARRRQQIILNGLRVRAKVLAIRRDDSLEVNGRSPWVIDAEFKDDMTDATVSCTSHYLWTNPAPRFHPGGEVTVYYLQGRPHKHAFDLDD
jgi:hypothetical protein